jgi:diadenosine tetraphosphatase ApaH/serine/threonine PP2A family protein phosphatase
MEMIIPCKLGFAIPFFRNRLHCVIGRGEDVRLPMRQNPNHRFIFVVKCDTILTDMRVLVVSDVHSNIIALDAVIQDAGQFDRVWCLGDVVGYGPDPNECINRLREFDLVCLAGNHDLGVVGKIGLWDFNSDAQNVAFWTRHQLTMANREWLETLPSTQLVTEHGITLVHGSPRDAVWEYIFTPPVARANFEQIETPICLNGHTHVPLIFRKPTYETGVFTERLPVNLPVSLTLDKLIINPGSVGQPRDDDPRASYAIIDLLAKTLTHRRVQYDVAATQKKMKQAQFPGGLIRRLRFGQ